MADKDKLYAYDNGGVVGIGENGKFLEEINQYNIVKTTKALAVKYNLPVGNISICRNPPKTPKDLR